jgi:hypothetical protein
MNDDPSKKNRSKKVKYGPMLCFTLNALHLSFAPPKLLLSQPAAQKAAARIATGTLTLLTVAQHKQRIGAASLKVSAAPLPVCLAAARPAPARLTRHSDAGLPPARPQRSTLTAHDVLCSQACRSP